MAHTSFVDQTDNVDVCFSNGNTDYFNGCLKFWMRPYVATSHVLGGMNLLWYFIFKALHSKKYLILE